MQKSALQFGEIIFQSKVIPLFLLKCSKLHSFDMVYCIPYMKVTVGNKKKKAKHGEMTIFPQISLLD